MGNMIRSSGAALLADSFSDEKNTKLQMLRLDCNIILDDGGISLLKAFQQSISLRVLLCKWKSNWRCSARKN